MEDAEDPSEVIDCSPELGTRRLSAADPFPLSAKFDPKLVSEKPGDKTEGENLLHCRNRSGRTRIEYRRRRTGKHVLCQSKVALN